MSSLLKYDATYGTLSSAFVTGDLDGKTNGSYAFGSGAAATIDNTTALETLMDVIVNLGSINPSGSPYITLWLLLSLDGTNFEDPSSAGAPPAGLATYSRGVSTGSSAKVTIFRGIILPPGKSKLLFQNNTGQTLATGGNTIKYWPYSYNLNG